jgi:hypothetical protein
VSALVFDPLLHRYALDGMPLARSVTGVLRDSGLVDFSHIPPTILDAARVRGTTVHQAVHYYNERDLDLAAFELDFPDYAPYLQAWLKFRSQRTFLPVLSEHRVASRRYQLAGTVDALGLLDGGAVLLDFATGDPAYCAKDLQTAAYLSLAREWADEDPLLAAFLERHPLVRRYAVRLRADATFTLEAYADPTDTRQFFTLVDALRIVDARRRRPLAEVA